MEAVMNLEWRIAGIPCQIKVLQCSVVPGTWHRDAPSDSDYYGYSEIEYEVLDRKGYPAPWLERKLTRVEQQNLENYIVEHDVDDT